MKLAKRVKSSLLPKVAPVRERGLKYHKVCHSTEAAAGRSRKGAWIEIVRTCVTASVKPSRSRKGAWIEIYNHGNDHKKRNVAPVRERGLK